MSVISSYRAWFTLPLSAALLRTHASVRLISGAPLPRQAWFTR